MWCRVLFLYIVLCISDYSNAQIISELWTNLSSDSGEKCLLKLDESSMKSQLNAVSQNEKIPLGIPRPDGFIELFIFERMQLLEPELSDKYPEIQTYIGHSNSNLDAECRISISKKGFYGMVKDGNLNYFIDPIGEGKYLSHYKSNRNQDGNEQMSCVSVSKNLLERANIDKNNFEQNNFKVNADGKFRKYRIAIGATAEYTAFHGGTIEDGLAAIVNTLNRVNFIFEKELAIGFVLANNNDLLIETSIENDPFNNFNLMEMMSQNQINTDEKIGNENYDIGHVFGTYGGGAAIQQCPCNQNLKAHGATGIGNPVGDFFDVNYVTHEIAHQFGAKHTFNSQAGQCHNNRSEESAYEPGSGTTIMAYQGLCNDDNIGDKTDAYFHIASLNQITRFVSNGLGNSCGQWIQIQENEMSVNAGKDYVIPPSTPFILNAQTEEENEKILFSWEQFDLNAKEAINSFGPLFRSKAPAEKKSRTFPNIESLLSNETIAGETLPTVARNMIFRLTKRVNLDYTNANLFCSDDMRVSVAENAAPFRLNDIGENTSPLIIGKNYEITWELGNTDKAPINCKKVNILMSEDGGYNFPNTIAVNVINDGSFSFIFPEIESDKIRFKIEAVDNIFFDISDVNQNSVLNDAPFFNLECELISSDILCENEEFIFLLKQNNFNGFNEQVGFSFENIPENLQPIIDYSTYSEMGGYTVSFSDLSLFNNVQNAVKITGISNENISSTSLDFSVNKIVDREMLLAFPLDGFVLPNNSPLFSWSKIKNADHYIVEVSQDESFDNIVKTYCTDENIIAALTLQENTQYFWRVVTQDQCFNSFASNTRSFTTGSNLNYCVGEINAGYEWIDGFVLGSFNNFSGNNDGYELFDEEVISVNIGESYNMSMYPGFQDKSWEENWRVALDFNQDGFFDEDEILFETNEKSKTVVHASIEIPSLETGIYALRVMMFFDEMNGCDGLHFGEIEDYKILIKNDCQDNDGDLICDDCDGVGEACTASQLDIKVLLQAAYNEEINAMSTSLSSKSLIPLDQPFGNDVYQYYGTEKINQIPNNIIDWVLVELRHGDPSIAGESTTTIIERQAALLMNDGRILSTKNELLSFNLTGYDEFSILVRHRNHLDILSSEKFKTADFITCDFTTNKEKALGANQQTELNNGLVAMFAGDFNQDGTIQTTDFDVWKQDPAKLNVYANHDANLDGVVQTTDFDWWVRNKSKNGIGEIKH